MWHGSLWSLLPCSFLPTIDHALQILCDMYICNIIDQWLTIDQLCCKCTCHIEFVSHWSIVGRKLHGPQRSMSHRMDLRSWPAYRSCLIWKGSGTVMTMFEDLATNDLYIRISLLPCSFLPTIELTNSMWHVHLQHNWSKAIVFQFLYTGPLVARSSNMVITVPDPFQFVQNAMNNNSRLVRAEFRLNNSCELVTILDPFYVTWTFVVPSCQQLISGLQILCDMYICNIIDQL